MHSREKGPLPKAPKATVPPHEALLPYDIEDFTTLTHRPSTALRREWLESYLSQGVLYHIEALSSYADFFNYCIDEEKNGEVGALAVAALVRMYLGSTLQKHSPLSQDQRHKPLIEVAKSLSPIVSDMSRPYALRSAAVCHSAFIALYFPLVFEWEGGPKIFYKTLIGILHVASTNLSDPLNPIGAWVDPKRKLLDSEEENSHQSDFLCDILESLTALLPVVDPEIISASSDGVVSDLEEIVLKFEHSEIVESALRALIAQLELKSLSNPKDPKSEEDVTLMVERLETLANPEFSNRDFAFENRKRWEELKDSLETVAAGKSLRVEVDWLKLKAPTVENDRKTSNLVVNWTLAEAIDFSRKVLGPEFLDLLREASIRPEPTPAPARAFQPVFGFYHLLGIPYPGRADPPAGSHRGDNLFDLLRDMVQNFSTWALHDPDDNVGRGRSYREHRGHISGWRRHAKPLDAALAGHL